MRREWTRDELEMLRALGHLGADQAAAALGRSLRSVKGAAYYYRISLRPTGSRRGRALGIPSVRDDETLRQIRALVLAGEWDMAAEELTAMSMAPRTQLCPACGVRPQRQNVSGLCTACHLKHQADRHRDRLAEIEAQRDAWTARQQVHRARENIRSEGSG